MLALNISLRIFIDTFFRFGSEIYARAMARLSVKEKAPLLIMPAIFELSALLKISVCALGISFKLSGKLALLKIYSGVCNSLCQ